MPKRFEHLRDALKETFADPIGWLAASLGALFVIFAAMLLPSLNLLDFIFSERQFDGSLKAVTAAQVLWNSRLVFVHENGWMTLVIAALFGINAAFITHYMRRQVRLNRAAGMSAFGVLVGLLGVGCASCGSVFLSTLLGTGAAVGFLGRLPLHGQEFSWIGIVVILLSMFGIAKRIVEPDVCAMPSKK